MAGQTLLTTILINARTGNGFSQVGNTLTELGSIVNGISQKLIDFGEDSIKVYRNYEKSMADAEVALSTTYGRGTRELNGVMSQLDAAATDWAATTIFHTNDVGNAISEAAHAGWDLDQIMSGIPAAMELAQAGGLDLSDAVNYIVKSTSAAGVGFEDLGGFIDDWAFAANSSASTIDEFGQAMLRMGSTMRFAGNTEELMTLIAVTANAGSVGSEAGTLIRNSMIRLIAPTDKAQEAMELLGATSEETAGLMEDQELAAANARLAAEGFSAYDGQGNLKNILDIYRELYVALGEVAGGYENIETNKDALGILSSIFPTRTITEALTLLRGAADGYDGLYEAMRGGDSEGYGEYAAATMMDTLDGKIETFESKIERLKQLVGENLAPQAISVMDMIGGVADAISGLDETKFNMLVSAAEGIALAGPGMLLAGGALRFIGLLSTPTGQAAVAVVALAAGLGALAAYSDAEFKGNFGTLELDLTTLKANVDSLTTDAEQQVAQIDGYTSQITALAEEYQTAVTAFSTELSTDVLAGKVLTEQEKIDLRAYGQSITDAVLEGISTKRDESLTFLNAITPSADEMSDSELQTYSGLYDSLFSYFGDLEGQARSIGEDLQDAIIEGLKDDGRLDEQERAIIQEYVDMLNRIQAEIAAQTSQADYYAELEKAQRVSLDSMDEYMTHLADNHEQRIEKINGLYDQEIGTARAAYEKEHGTLTDAEWQATNEYKLYQGQRESALQQISEQTGTLAMTAFSGLLGDSDLGQTFAFSQRLMAEAPRDKNGNIDYENIDWAGYLSKGLVPATFYQDLVDLQRGNLPFGLGASKFGKMLEPWKDLPGISDIYSMFSGGFWDGSGLGNLQSSAADFMQRNGGWAPGGQFGVFNEGYGIDITTNVDSTELDATIATAEEGADLDVDTVVDRSALDGVNVDPIPLPIQPYVEGTDRIAGLEDQGVQVSVDGDAAELQATIDGKDGQTLIEYLDGDATDLSMSIQDQNGKTLVENVRGNTAALASAIASYSGRTITVNIRGNRLFAEGGRATTASIFGEAGPEWAIPEEHSERTAQLLDAARAASGFTWPEIIARFGGLNANPDNTPTTFIYSPTINAQNASGVDQVLRDDKRRMEKWFEEKQMRDRAEVYA